MKELTVRDLIHLLRRVDLIDATVRIASFNEGNPVVLALHPTIAKVVEGNDDDSG